MELSIINGVVHGRFHGAKRQFRRRFAEQRLKSRKRMNAGMNVFTDVKQIISKQVGVPLDQLGRDSNLEAIGVESLDIIEIIFALEKKYNIAIPFNANESAALAFETIGQVSDAVEKLVVVKSI